MLPLTTLLWLVVPPALILLVVLVHFFRARGPR